MCANLNTRSQNLNTFLGLVCPKTYRHYATHLQRARVKYHVAQCISQMYLIEKFAVKLGDRCRFGFV